VSDLKAELAALHIERGPERGGAGRWVLWAILLVLAAGGSLAGWKWVTRERPLEVQAALVTVRAAGTQAAVLNASGYVTARRRATVSSKVTGRVIEVNVEEGMRVTEGQVLARLDDATARAMLALAEAQAAATRRQARENEAHLAEARLTLGRMTALVKDGFATQREVDAARADIDTTEAHIAVLNEQVHVSDRQVDLQKADLDNMVIRAPFSGIAISKDAQPGEMVSPNSAGGGFTRTGICTIVDMRSLEIEVDVNESYINRVQPGQDVAAILDAYPDWQIPARVITIVPTADRQKATVQVRIAFKKIEPRILPDMGVKVTFLREATAAAGPATAARPVTLAPKAAVRAEAGQSVVFVLHGDVVERRAVQVGGTDGDRIEVTAGLASGDRVVISPPPELKDGAKVIVK
jgi:RND family efflux transporter MFP subunit